MRIYHSCINEGGLQCMRYQDQASQACWLSIFCYLRRSSSSPSLLEVFHRVSYPPRWRFRNLVYWLISIRNNLMQTQVSMKYDRSRVICSRWGDRLQDLLVCKRLVQHWDNQGQVSFFIVCRENYAVFHLNCNARSFEIKSLGALMLSRCLAPMQHGCQMTGLL